MLSVMQGGRGWGTSRLMWLLAGRGAAVVTLAAFAGGGNVLACLRRRKR